MLIMIPIIIITPAKQKSLTGNRAAAFLELFPTSSALSSWGVSCVLRITSTTAGDILQPQP